MKTCVTISPLNLLYEPQTYNQHFLQISRPQETLLVARHLQKQPPEVFYEKRCS